MLTVGSLFAGVGGFDLGLERAGMRSVWQCDNHPYAKRVLEKHWPDVLRVSDIRDVRAGSVPWVDVIAGGFPCQGLSDAGLRLGLADPRSGLWFEMFRVIRELRPRYVVVENVRALTSRGLGRVLADLAAIGYDAEWDCIPAEAVGAHHQRDRIWIIAYPDADSAGRGEFAEHDGGSVELGRRAPWGHTDGLRHEVADADRGGRDGRPGQLRAAGRRESEDRGGESPGAESAGAWLAHEWPPEPAVGRVVDGFPGRVDRVRALGNALVPHIAEALGRRILEHEGRRMNPSSTGTHPDPVRNVSIPEVGVS